MAARSIEGQPELREKIVEALSEISDALEFTNEDMRHIGHHVLHEVFFSKEAEGKEESDTTKADEKASA